MFNKILVPLDGSARAEQVLQQLGPLLRRRDAEVLLVQAVPGAYAFGRDEMAAVESERRTEAARYVTGLAAKLEERGILARAKVLRGSAAEAILEIAAREGSDLIALTTHGRTGLARWALGSVAEKVLRGSSLPLFLWRSFRDGTSSAAEPRMRRILVPTDDSEASRAVLPWVVEWARLFEAEVVVLYAAAGIPVPAAAYYGNMIDPLGPAYAPPPTPEQVEEVPRWTEERLSAAGLKVTPRIVTGDAASVIVDEAVTHEADLIAMATHGRSGVSRWVLGSVAEKVLRTAPVPMLLVRARG